MRQLAVVLLLSVSSMGAGCATCDDCYPHGPTADSSDYGGGPDVSGRAGSVLDGGYVASTGAGTPGESETLEAGAGEPTIETARATR